MKVNHIGRHRVTHGDVTDSSVMPVLMGRDKAEIFYSDPPWGDGNLKYWQTMNKKMTGAEPKKVDLGVFMRAVFSAAASYTTNVVLIEYGVRWRDMIKQYGEQFGLKWYGTADLVYRSGSKFLPLDLHLFGVQELTVPPNYFENLYHTHGLNTLKNAITPFVVPGKIILDPCCGMGYTAQMAVDSGMIFRGNELNSKRLEKTIKRLK